MPFASTVTVVDPTARIRDSLLLEDNARAALAEWGRYVTGEGVLDILIRIGMPAGGGAVGTYALSVEFSRPAFVTDNWGTHVVSVQRTGAAHELLTGVDLNGTQAEFEIVIRPDFLDRLWLDPTPSMTSDRPPPGQYDAVSLFLREIGRGLGVTGFANQTTGEFQRSRRTEFESHIVRDETGGYVFAPTLDDSMVAQLFAEGLPLTFTPESGADPNLHLFSYGNRGGAGRELLSGLFAGVGLIDGERYSIGQLDLAILADIGLPVTFEGDLPLVNQYDQSEELVFMMGSNSIMAVSPILVPGEIVPLRGDIVGTVVALGNFNYDPVTNPYSKVDALVLRPDGSYAWHDLGAPTLPARVLPALGNVEALPFIGDFAGSTGSDLLLFNPASRALEIFDVTALQRRAFFVLNPDTAVVGAGNLDSDARAEIVFHDRATQSVYYWTGNTLQNLFTAGPEWSIWVGNVVGNATEDLLLFNSATRAVMFYEVAGGGFIDFRALPDGLDIVSIADITGDRLGDIIATDGSTLQYWDGFDWISLGGALPGGATLIGIGDAAG